jgi:membrane protein DedA with SNARE-associated domain
VIPLPTKAFIISSGALGTPTGPFVLAVIVARAARYAGEAWLGAQMGDQAWPWLRAHGRELAIAALGLFLLLFVLLKVSDRHAKLRNAVQG